jgi:hypothetical protein
MRYRQHSGWRDPSGRRCNDTASDLVSFNVEACIGAEPEPFGKVSDMPGRAAIRVTARVVLCTAVVTLAFGAVADAQTAPATIAPHQTFIGNVNGLQVSASVNVVCPGPLRLGQMGHPASGQTVGVSSPAPPIAWTGNTGSRGHVITARFITASAVATPAVAIPAVTFSQYGTQPIPTTGMLPCTGSGAVVFSPTPTSHTSHSAKESVSYVATCTNPCPVAGAPIGVAFGVTARTPRSSHGVISGQLGIEGGPYPGGLHPTAGVVKVEGPQKVGRVKVPESGSFAVDVVPGVYTLTGCGGTKNRQCGPPQDVTVKAQKTTHVEVPWLLAP